MSVNVSYVLVEGPEPFQDEFGDEVPQWSVTPMSGDDTEVEEPRWYPSREQARVAGVVEARQYRAEMVDETFPA